jgi:AcrR family transcriptional regulator
VQKRRFLLKKAPRQARARATVEALLQATADILKRDGYAKLTTNRIAERAGVNIASLYQYFPGKEAIVAELRSRHGAALRGAARQVLLEHRGRGLGATLSMLVSMAIAEHAKEPALHRAFTEELPALGYPEVSARDAPLVMEFRRLLEGPDVAIGDVELAQWMVATISGAVIHRAAVERPADLSNGRITEELLTVLLRYLRRRRGAGVRGVASISLRRR